jgi:integrase
MENKIQKIEKEKDQLLLEVESKLDLLVNGQKINSNKLEDIGNDLRKGFIGLALRNEELLKSNDQLKQQLDLVLQELNVIKQEREEKAARKEARANQKRLPKRDQITAQIYKELIKEAEGPTYINARLRLALCLLAVTGVRINELLNIKVSDLATLIQENWIAIDRSKRGPSNHKAFLTKEGKKIIQDRKKDFELIFLMKELDAYLFTSESDHFKKLRREAITRDVNKVMRLVSKQLPSQPNVTSHSFRIGYITQLWKDSKDIEFVKQTIGHRKLDTTSTYVTQLSDQERQKRINQFK